MRIRLLTWACVAGLAALLGPSASSAIDLTGSWTVTAQTFLGPITGTWDFYQTATQPREAPLRIELQAHDAQGISCWEESYDGSEIEIAGARLTAHH
jgi:hypothetical protein